MTIYDGLMLAAVLAGMGWGAWKGLTWQVASMASLVLGYLVAYPTAGQIAPSFPGNPTVAWALALATAYVAVSASVFLAAWLFRLGLRKMKFEAYDRHLGSILGGLGGAAVAIVATVLVVSVFPSLRTPVLTSPSGRAVSKALSVAQAALPPSVREDLRPFWETARQDGLMTLDPAASAEDRETSDQREGGHTELASDSRSDQEDGSILRAVIEAEGKRIGRSLSDAIESQARGDDRDDRGARRRR
jgi:membrane protein required for colicin V production